MLSTNLNLNKLKTNLRLAINRLKLLEKKKTELGLKSRKEVSEYIRSGKIDRARVRVENIIRDDYLIEAMELIEMYCDLLIARFGLIQTQKELDPGLIEATATIIWAAPRLMLEVEELKPAADLLKRKYGKEFAAGSLQAINVSDKVVHKLGVEVPPRSLIEKYVVEIARSYNIPYDPDLTYLAADETYLADLMASSASPNLPLPAVSLAQPDMDAYNQGVPGCGPSNQHLGVTPTSQLSGSQQNLLNLPDLPSDFPAGSRTANTSHQQPQGGGTNDFDDLARRFAQLKRQN